METAELNQEKLHIEIQKLMAETVKIQAETKYYPLIVLATIVAATVALIGTLVKVLG